VLATWDVDIHVIVKSQGETDDVLGPLCPCPHRGLALHTNPSIRFKANELIIERAWGKLVTPTLDITMTGGANFVIRPSAEVIVPGARAAVEAELGPAQATMMMGAAVVETLALVTAGPKTAEGVVATTAAVARGRDWRGRHQRPRARAVAWGHRAFATGAA
jgi:hypothetical protein